MYNWKNVGTKMDPQSVNCQIIVGAIRPQLGKRVLACPNVGDLGGGGGGGGALSKFIFTNKSTKEIHEKI